MTGRSDIEVVDSWWQAHEDHDVYPGADENGFTWDGCRDCNSMLTVAPSGRAVVTGAGR